MCYILCETPSSESHFFPITASGKEKKPPWTSSDLFKATENPNCLLCSAQLLPFIICQLHSPKCPQKCLPLREKSTGGYWNTKGWEDMVPRSRCPARWDSSTDLLPLLLREATWMSPPPGTGSCHQFHTRQSISDSGLWLLLCCPSSLTHHMLLEGEDNFCFFHHWLPSAWRLVGT